jgi:hypothetical protein
VRERREAGRAADDLDDAVDRTRRERVVAAAIDPTHELCARLGQPPLTWGGLAAWCGIAEQVTAHNDRHARAESSERSRAGPDRIDWSARLQRLEGPRWTDRQPGH